MSEQILVPTSNDIAAAVREAVAPPLIPAHVAANLLEFLRRVKLEGVEAVAWCEAYAFIQRHVPQQGQPQGVPFSGLLEQK